MDDIKFQKDKEATFYIFIIFTKSKDTDIPFTFSSKKTEIIKQIKNTIEGGIRYCIILKHIDAVKSLSDMVNLSLYNKGEIFNISFSYSDNSFIFNPILKIKKNKTSNEKNISQKNVIKITEKINIFEKCLEESNDKTKIEALYKDSVDYFNLNKDFDLLIYLFIKIFGKNKSLKEIGKKLLDIFWDNTTNDIIDNMNKPEICGEYLKSITELIGNEGKIILENDFDKAKYYGLILLYLNTYDNSKFQSLVKKFQEIKEEKDNFFFDILVHFSSVFYKDINVDLEQYINYLIGKDFKTFETSGFAYCKRIEDFILIINKKKDKLIKIPNFKVLKIPKELKYNLEKPDKFIEKLNDLINFSKTQKKLILFLSGTFWKGITEVLAKPSADNIYYLYQMRVVFKIYLQLVKDQFKKEHAIYINAEETDGKDELAITLNRIIQKNIEETKDISNDEIINQITKFNFFYKEDTYINRRELNFLDKINFDENETEWMKYFKDSNFENIFKNDIEKYILKLVSKIKKMEDLGIVIDIINEDEIKKMEKIEYLIGILRRKALNLMKNSESLKNSNIKKDKLLSLTKLFIIIYKNIQKLEKIKDILDKLGNENKHLIFMKLLKIFDNDKLLQEYIFEFYINNMDIYYKNIIDLFEVLNEENIKNFMSKISDKKDEKKKSYRVITEENFFMENESLNINLLKELNKKIDYIKKTYYYGASKKVLEKIYDDLENKKLETKYLKSLLSFSKENVIKRLELLNILNKPLIPEDKYNKLISDYNTAEINVKELAKISEALKIFHKDFHKNEIKKIEEQIDKFKNGQIKEFENIAQLKLEIKDDNMDKKVEKINNLKDIQIFKRLFYNTEGSNQDERFDLALKNLPTEFNNIKRNTKNVDGETKKQFQLIMKIIGLNNDEKTQKELKYMEDSSGAEEDIKSIIYFCENFKINNNCNNNENINDNKEHQDLEDFLKIKYEDIKNNKSKKENLNILKEMGIYDCEKKGISIDFFNLFNNQNEAINFLLSKTHENLEIIKDKIISIDNTVKSNDIDEVDNCIDFFNNVLLNAKNKFELFEKIKTITENLLNNFKKFIKIFPYLVELDNNTDNSYNLYIKAKKYFSNASYFISLNSEEYCFVDDINNKEEYIDLEAIKSIKHKINIPNEEEIKLKENKEFPEGQERISLDKKLLLHKYKEVVANIERIEQFISVFKKKGCSLPIEIDIKIKYPEVSYFLKKNKISNEELLNYLLNVKNYLEKALDLNYKKQQNLRFLYGKQFDTLSRHISGSLGIPSFLRYILNNLNDDINIKEGIKSSPRSTQNYVDEYKDYTDDSFIIYNKYISSVMKENGISIEELYEKMKIKPDTNDEKIYKGIYLYKSDFNSMEEDILKIFIEKTKNIPIAQNILISNKETSYDEIQAFFHRAFLCRFNTLFAIEINDSLSDIQLKIMNSFINRLLKFQLDKYNKANDTKVDIKETSKYIEPLIIFVYNVNKLNEYFLGEINKFEPGVYPKIKKKISLDKNISSSFRQTLAEKVETKLNLILLMNTHIYSSEICGLGKTSKIKYLIEKDKDDYIYFPLGGKLSRNIIFKKVENILKKVKNIKKTSIHLDLYETDDVSILNEFLFSFCFTKFYSNDENVLYIPINIKIYIEIPNCFNDFIDNYPILKYFKIDKIIFKEKEKLRLDKEQIKFFNWMIPEIKKEGKLVKPSHEEYINSNIGSKIYSYHQINIFIKLFIYQYKLDNTKLRFYDENDKDITKKCIEQFAECTKYFTQGVYAQLLTKTSKESDDLSLKKEKIKNSEDASTSRNEINNSNYLNSNIPLDLDSDFEKNIKNESCKNNNNDNNNKSSTMESKEKIRTPISSPNDDGKLEQKNNYINILSKLYDSDLNTETYETPLIFNLKDTENYKKIDLSQKELEKLSEIDFLIKIKEILNLENPIDSKEKEKGSNLKPLIEIIHQDNYVITIDNFRKMVLIIYRILADIPVILMGETGCGKTGLIRKLYQLLNNGKEMDKDKNMINVDSSINDEKLIKKMNDINEEANKTDKDFWVLFDEINTCNSLGLLNEIFINRTYDGKEINKNIRLIGTCNPYRLKTEKEENSGLTHPYKSKNLVYDVNILPQSLMYFVFNFGFLKNDDESKYIESILINHFKKKEKFEPNLIKIVKDIISKCHIYFRKNYGISVVSLREIKRFVKLYDNLVDYFNNKDKTDLENNKIEKELENQEEKIKIKNEKKKLNKIKSFIVAIYLNYYIRLIDQEMRTIFEADIKSNLQELANYYAEKSDKNETVDIVDNNKKGDENQERKKNNDSENNFTNDLGIKWEPLIKEYRNYKSDNNKTFSIFFENECDYIIENVNLDKGIAKNRILKENIFLQFISITSNIPLIIIGKPGSSKSLSSQQLKKSMRGRLSKSNFFRKYPQILPTYFQGSESTLAEDIENLFDIGKEKLKKYAKNKENMPISLLIFDEIGLSEFAKDNPVKVLHKNLEYDGVKDGLSFVGFSNWKLDSSKLNRVLYLSVPDLDSHFDDLKDTAKCIAKSLRGNNVDESLLKIICKSYKSYQEKIKKIKEYVVYKELELQEMNQALDSLNNDEINNLFGKEKKDITLVDFKKNRKKIETNKKYSWKYGNFDDVKKMDEFKALYMKNRSVIQDFHGNRDFYNYNRGVCNIKSILKNSEIDNDVSQKIEKVIERNFGGIDINLNLDFDLDYNDESDSIDKFKKIIEKYFNEEKINKLPSVFLFKYIFNEELKSLYKLGNENNENEKEDINKLKLEKYEINDNNLTKYDLIECINGNINDNDARFLLLEIDEGLKYLVYQNIISQNKDKTIIYMEGSPFIDDIKDKNGEYKIKKISEIQNYCKKEMVLILSNLNQIYPFLYDFFNRNFIIKEDDKKYGRICQGNFTEQLTLVHDKFRIIIMIDKNYIYEQESPFLNRFEKAIVKFEELLNDKQKAASKNIFNELKIKEKFEKMNINYNIKNLLINCDESSIDRLYFYYSNKNLKFGPDEMQTKIFEKIARTLPQDIIINLEDNHPIKSIYNNRQIYNYRDYINYLNKLTKDKKNIFKFSIIYTFSNIISNIEGINDNSSQLIVSTIKRENNMIETINEKKFKNKKNDNNYFIMHFYQDELDKINFIISTLKNNYEDDDIKFILIVHIKRNDDKNKKEKIYSIPNIDEKVDQIFIDNLNGMNISLESIYKNGLKTILEDPKLIEKQSEFFKALKTYYNSYTNKIDFIENYLPKIISYLQENKEFIDIIWSKALSLIYKENKINTKDNKDNKENILFFNKIKSEIFNNTYITNNSVDIVSSLINDVIIDKILKNAIMKVLDTLESDNFLTTLLNIDNNNKLSGFLSSKENLLQIMEKYLNSVEINDMQNKAIFKNNYLVPGFLSFYNTITNFITKNICQDFFKNEKKFRDFLKGNIIKLKFNYQTEQSRLLEIVYKEIISDESDNYKYINEVIDKFPNDLLLNDYINYFININKENINETLEELLDVESNSSFENDDEEIKEEVIKEEGEELIDFYTKIIKQIVDLKYKEDTKIIEQNKDNELNKFLIKIIWLNANKSYILTIIKLFREVRNKIYGNKKSYILLEQIDNLICNKKIKYITDENRNPEHTREVNECFCIIMSALYLSITDLERIKIYDPKNYKDFIEIQENQVKVKIKKYLECLKYIVKISQPFDYMLYLFSNELYIIVNLNSIINLLMIQKNEYIDTQIIEDLIKNLRNGIDIIRESKFIKVNELKQNIEDLFNIIGDNVQKKDKNYYNLIRNILLQEFKKIKDKIYRSDIFQSYMININEKEILLNSNEIFEILLKTYVIPLKEKFFASIDKFETKGDLILIILENKIKEEKNEYLSQILLYFFEKMSYIYIYNYFKSKVQKKDDKNLLDGEPLTIFKNCLELLSKLSSSESKIKNIAKLFYIGYIRVFIFKLEEYLRNTPKKIGDPKSIVDIINSYKNNLSFMVELYFYKVIYYKNNKNINAFTTKSKKYNLELFNNYKDFFSSPNKDNNSSQEKDENENSFFDLLDENFNNLKNSKEKYPYIKYFLYSDYLDENYLNTIIKDEKNKYPVLERYLKLKTDGNMLNDFYIYHTALYSLNEEFSSKITRQRAKKETLDEQLIYKENKDMFLKFIDIFNKLSGDYDSEDEDNINENNENVNIINEDNENENIINTKLNEKLPLYNFLLVDENEFCEKYKYFYEKFIEKHNEIVFELFSAKSKTFDVQNKKKEDRINIQNITKEEEIFITKDDNSINNVLFNYSYRSAILNGNYSEYNKYEVDKDYIEEMMTDKLLKNKKLFSMEIFKFNYKNEDLEFKNKNICTKFKEKINMEKLSINDKIVIYQYFKENKGSENLYLRLMDDFAYLIIYTTETIDKKENKIQSKIYSLSEELENNISKDFKEIFKDKDELTIKKLLNIYEYFQILCFNEVKGKMKQYQQKIKDEKQNNLINNYIKNVLTPNEIFRNNLEIALRKFIICFLAKEEKKEDKIKLNENNIQNYLEIEDLWDKDFYKKNEFYQELKKIKKLGIKINNVIPFYDKCFENYYKNYFNDVITEINNRESERIREENEKEKNDINNININEDDIDDNLPEIQEKNNEENNENKDNNQENNDDNGDDYISQGEEEEELDGMRF